jgi:hypothetical protein
MNSILCALIARSILVCTPGLVCQCSSPDAPVPVQAEEPVRYREDELVGRVRKFQQGDTMQRCTSLLGEPTVRSPLHGKEPHAPLIGTSFYYAVRQKGSHLDKSTDRYLQVWFDATGHMEVTRWYGEP